MPTDTLTRPKSPSTRSKRSTTSPKSERHELEVFAEFCADALTLEDGSPLELHDFQRAMLADLFSGIRETLILVPKKNGKSTLLGALALYHLCTTPVAECVIAAASRDQAQIMLRQAQGFIRRSEPLKERLLVKQREIVHRTLGGRVRILASDVDTADGVIPTLALVDELHRHKSADLYGIFRDGLGPRDGKMVTISTAGDTEDSPLGELRSKAYALGLTQDGAYRHARSDGFVMHEWALEGNADLEDIDLVKQANPAPWQTIESLHERWESPSMTPAQWARFACGVWGLGAERAFDPNAWEALGDADREVDEGRIITLGFDGARRRDTTALVGCDVETGHLFVLGFWPRPFDADDEWETPEHEVDQLVDYAFKRWSVWNLYADPPYWESALDRWAGDHGIEKVTRWWTNNIKKTAIALRAFRNDMVPGRMSHDGDRHLAEHIRNAVRKDTRMVEDDVPLWVIRKESSSSPRKIDLTMAAVLAWRARGEAIAKGALEEPTHERAAW